MRKLKLDSTVIPEVEDNPKVGRSRMGKEKQESVIEERAELTRETTNTVAKARNFIILSAGVNRSEIIAQL